LTRAILAPSRFARHPRFCAPNCEVNLTLARQDVAFARCISTRYTAPVIKSFRHDGLQRFFSTGSKAGIQPSHAKKLSLQLLRLDGATSTLDMNLPGWDCHPLKDDLAGHWAVSVNGNWRLTFTFEGSDAILVDYQDYH
jgi:proteic killer suppression protein